MSDLSGDTPKSHKNMSKNLKEKLHRDDDDITLADSNVDSSPLSFYMKDLNSRKSLKNDSVSILTNKLAWKNTKNSTFGSLADENKIKNGLKKNREYLIFRTFGPKLQHDSRRGPKSKKCVENDISLSASQDCNHLGDIDCRNNITNLHLPKSVLKSRSRSYTNRSKFFIENKTCSKKVRFFRKKTIFKFDPSSIVDRAKRKKLMVWDEFSKKKEI